MYDEFGGSTNGDRRKYEEDDSTINDEEEGVLRPGYTNNYGYGGTEVVAPTDSENERGNTPNRYPKDVRSPLIPPPTSLPRCFHSES